MKAEPNTEESSGPSGRQPNSSENGYALRRPSTSEDSDDDMSPSEESVLVNTLKDLFKQQFDQRESHFSSIKGLLTEQNELIKKQNEQNLELLEIMKTVADKLGTSSRKRKRRPSSSESEA